MTGEPTRDTLLVQRAELLAALKEARAFMAAALRAIGAIDGLAVFTAEWEPLGIPDGVGVRVQAAIDKAEGR